MVAIAIVAAAGWLALYLGIAAITREGGRGGGWGLRRGIRRLRLDGGPPDLGDPALVNLVTTGCQLDGAAFAATILHLGDRRVLALSEPEPGRLWCAPTREGAGDLDLVPYERLVLDDVTSQFAEADGAPFEALADMCFGDVKGVWDPFEEAVRAEGRRRGLTRARLPRAAVALLYVGAVPVSAFAAAAVGYGHPTRWVGATLTALAVVVAIAWLTGMLGRHDRLTVAGAALAAWAARVTAQQAPAGDHRAEQARARGRHRRRAAGSRAGAHSAWRRAGGRAPWLHDHRRHPGTAGPGTEAGLVLAGRPVAPGTGRAAA